MSAQHCVNLRGSILAVPRPLHLIVGRHPLSSSLPAKQPNERLENALMGGRGKHACFPDKNRLVCGEELARPRETLPWQATGTEGSLRDPHSPYIAIGVAGYLAQDPVRATRRCEDDCGSKLGRRQVRERESNENYCAGPRSAHAASSSGRFQSAASDCSLSSAVSAVGTPTTVIKSCEPGARDTGFLGRMLPFSSTSASMVVRILLTLSRSPHARPTLGITCEGRGSCCPRGPRDHPLVRPPLQLWEHT